MMQKSGLRVRRDENTAQTLTSLLFPADCVSSWCIMDLADWDFRSLGLKTGCETLIFEWGGCYNLGKSEELELKRQIISVRKKRGWRQTAQVLRSY